MKNSKKTIFNKDYVDLIAEIVKIRKSKGLSQKDLALKLDVDTCYIGRMEIRERRLDLIELIAILKALGVSKREILAMVEKII
ncbi:MAG: helix-turn-helix transcriptional regulator [Alphaproteobacteria bacterium]|nr:helix-turn-helix transcriptional regulator [Alphaproteobacteria bacterium]